MRLALTALWALLPALAQNSAEVRGSVVDARGGESLSNVVIQLVGGAYRATTDATGHFRIPAVTPGDYTFKAFFEGKQVGKSADGVHVGGGGLELREPLTVGGGESK